MHVLVEMNLKLHTVEYVVFDEADRYLTQFNALGQYFKT